ncbi:uncharacterized protein LOC115883383 [Sitophilus oryzae]|uniref:Uncharacterized protein LOC115883383 n=1 Tax=Sitophilus oryzae TaxID=7048 RepID=A0A6J2Y3U8_SITOR|nr:uncharacterized protein LOC115883383 [Sitophilus oryzae]
MKSTYYNSKIKHNHIIKYGQQDALPCETHIDQVENMLMMSEDEYISNKDNYVNVRVEYELESPPKEIKCDLPIPHQDREQATNQRHTFALSCKVNVKNATCPSCLVLLWNGNGTQ